MALNWFTQFLRVRKDYKMKIERKILSKTDQIIFKEFKKRYEGWDIIRYEDNSLEFIKPKREERK